MKPVQPDIFFEELTKEKIRELLEEYRILENSVAWKHFSSVLREQYDLRMVELLSTPLGKMDDVLLQEYTKGECASLLIITQILPNLIEYLDSLLKIGETDGDSAADDYGSDSSE